MGRLKNLVSATVSGNVGSMNFRRRGDSTVVAIRSYQNSSRGEGATDIQRRHRSRMANVVSFFRAIKPLQIRAWENKKPGVTDYNQFFSINLASSPIFLTQREVSHRACVIAPYIVSRGSLPTLPQNCFEGVFHSGVYVSPSLDFTSCTVGEFSASVIAVNSGWLQGDKLAICCIKQGEKLVGEDLIPFISPSFFTVTIDVNNSSPLHGIAGFNRVMLFHESNGEVICSQRSDAAFAIHAREDSGSLLTSSQQVVFASFENPVFLKYTSQVQELLSMESYGYQSDVLLTPAREDKNKVSYPAVIASILWNGQPLENGATVREEGVLIISGAYLSAKTIQVLKDGESIPLVFMSEDKIRMYIDVPGAYQIVVNDVLYLAFTCKGAPKRVDIILDNWDVGFAYSLEGNKFLKNLSGQYERNCLLTLPDIVGRRVYVEYIKPYSNVARNIANVNEDLTIPFTLSLGDGLYTGPYMWTNMDSDSTFRSSFLAVSPTLLISCLGDYKNISLYYYS